MGTKVYIVGKQLVDYEDRKTGESIKGYKLFFFCPADGVQGNYADSVWIDYKRSPEVFASVDAGAADEAPETAPQEVAASTVVDADMQQIMQDFQRQQQDFGTMSVIGMGIIIGILLCSLVRWWK